MAVTPETLIAAAFVTPIAGAIAIAALRHAPNLRETATLVTAAVLFMLVVSLTGTVLAGGRPTLSLIEVMPGLTLGFQVEPLGMLFALVASGLWIVNSIYSIGYMRSNGEVHQTRFYVCFALALASTIGIAFAGNLLTLFLFYEALTLVTYPLVTHAGTLEARRAGRTYIGLLVGTSILFLLIAIVWTFQLAGTLEFRRGGLFSADLGAATLSGLLALYVFGIGKAAIMPVHRWLPAAMVAPTPVSALLHAVAVVKAGVFCVIKVIVYVLGAETLGVAGAAVWLPYLAGFTIVAASVVALRSDNLKRRLAYSTVSQLSYVVLATALLAPVSLIGASLHVAAHAVGKITLFFAAGAIYTAAHKTEVSQLDGIGRRMPWTMGAFALGALSMIGLPPAAGFVSKWYMLQGALATSQWVALSVIALSTVLTASYFAPILYRAFLVRPPAGEHAHGEAHWTMVLALTVTAAATVLLFFQPQVPLALARQLANG
jgi:multicomponent Na+:H+ antiporter subunit D